MNPATLSDLTDSATARVLGLSEYLERLEPSGEPGRRRLRRLEAYGPEDREARTRAVRRLQKVEAWAVDHTDRRETLADHLAELPAIETPLRKLDGETTLADADLFELKRFGYHGSRALHAADDLPDRLDAPDDGHARLRRLVRTIHPGGEETPRFQLSAELDEELADRLDCEKETASTLDEERRRVGEAVVDDVGGSLGAQGRYHPPNDTEDEALRGRSHLRHRSGGWFVHSDRIAELERELEARRERIEEAERRVRRELTEVLSARRGTIAALADFLGALDLQLAKVRLKEELDGCWGRWCDDSDEPNGGRDEELRIEAGRDPRTAALVASQNGSVQPIDLELRAPNTVVTGPNMGGKSALLRLVGICQWATHHACPVPADAFATRPVGSIVYVGSEEPDAVDAAHGLSSFGREVRRLVDTLENARRPVLWLLDEVGRGTHPGEGAELALELLEELRDRGDTAIVATHFPDLADHEGVDTLRIRGLAPSDAIDADLSATDTLEGVERALRRAMDFQPERRPDTDIPRDARRVAAALGLNFDP